MTNQTLLTFNYPNSIIHEYHNWAVLLRPQQITLGSLILATKSNATSFSNLQEPCFIELPTVIKNIEHSLKKIFNYQKINYLMLMMVDPHVHWHVIPRYDQPQLFDTISFQDPGWPALPNFKHTTALSQDQYDHLLSFIKKQWVLD
ncbi:MAG: HIT family protein [Alphaproteobacteria bacterium]|nr:HIT family protein [Alphaproteobacteria bacterium]